MLLCEQEYKYIKAEAIIDNIGISWDSIKTSLAKDIFIRERSSSLFLGSTGIVFFLLEYYKTSKDKECFYIIKNSIPVIHEFYKKESNSYGFYKGKSGYIYLLVELYKVTSEQEYLQYIKDLIDEPIYNEGDLFNLESGLSGYLLALLKVTEIDISETIIKYIEKTLNLIIINSKRDKDGIYWDEEEWAIDKSIGYLKGNSGIAYVLNLFIDNCKNKEQIQKVISLALDWEDSKFDRSIMNWKDPFNEKIYSHKNIFNKKDHKEKFFNSYGNTQNIWIGKPGMILTRKFCKRKNYNSFGAISNSIDSLCIKNGGGNLFCKYVLSELNKEVFTKCFEEGNKFKSGVIYNEHIPDCSFLNGVAGIGYLQLIIENKTTDNVLFPQCKIPSFKVRNASINELSETNKLFNLSFNPLKSKFHNKNIHTHKKLKLSRWCEINEKEHTIYYRDINIINLIKIDKYLKSYIVALDSSKVVKEYISSIKYFTNDNDENIEKTIQSLLNLNILEYV
ncbi:lanthionine synthetase LanC family protein [Flammeovirga pectinis]|nr:lanthionine synthetase LanC family protein [Flammeovirga pectinis]